MGELCERMVEKEGKVEEQGFVKQSRNQVRSQRKEVNPRK